MVRTAVVNRWPRAATAKSSRAPDFAYVLLKGPIQHRVATVLAHLDDELTPGAAV